MMSPEDPQSTPPLSLREDFIEQLRRYGRTDVPAIKVTSYDATAKLEGLTVVLQQRFVPVNERVLTVRTTCPDCWLEVTSLPIESQEDFNDAFARPLSTHICRGQARPPSAERE